MSEKEEKILPPRKLPPCREKEVELKKHFKRNIQVYDAFPRDCKFAFMTPGYYATGFRILDVYKSKPDFSEFRKLAFLEDPKQAGKWGLLKKRIPLPEGRVTDLPGTREVHYRNYCLRSLLPESASSWRNSISKEIVRTQNFEFVEENEPATECVCEEE